MLGIAIAAVISGFLQCFVQGVRLYNLGWYFFHIKEFFYDDNVRKVFKLLTGVLLGVSASQCSLMADTVFVSFYHMEVCPGYFWLTD